MFGYKDIFVFVAGTTPQIITETIYALSRKTPPVHPDEIYIITTLTGKKFIQKSLIAGAVLTELAREYAIPAIPVKEDSFIIPKDEQDSEIDDIRNEEENELMGNIITSLIRNKTQDAFSRLHCSIAGGRKTMSFYLGAALQLFGRPQDRLYHVLVSPEFESNPSFFYKPKKNKVIEGRGANGTTIKLNTRDAVIQLVELPFIRMNRKISFEGKDFRDLVNEGQRTIDTAMMHPELIVNLIERFIRVGETIIEMLPIQLMLYSAFLRQKLNYCSHPEKDYCLQCTDCFKSISDFTTKFSLEQMAHDHRTIYKSSSMRTDDFLEKWKDGINSEVIRQNISKIKKAIGEQLKDETLTPFYTISCIKQYAGSRYGVRIEKGKVRIG